MSISNIWTSQSSTSTEKDLTVLDYDTAAKNVGITCTNGSAHAGRRDQLAAEYLWLARDLAWRHRALSEEFDEVLGDARLGLAQAIATWEPGHGNAFGSWAYLKIVSAIRDGRRRRHHLTRWRQQQLRSGATMLASDEPPVSLDARIPGGRDQTLFAPDLLEDRYADQSGLVFLQELVRGLPARERLAFLLREQWGLKHRQIGALLGVSAAMACRLDGRARRHLAWWAA